MAVELLVEERAGLRLAVLAEGRRLIDLAVDRLGEARLYQSIWRVKIDRLAPRIGAFALLGSGRSGLFREGARQSGETLIAQIKSVRSEGKADILTEDLALAGPYFVYLPRAPTIRVSRQAREAAEFAELIAALAREGITGGIVRTAALTAAPEEIRKDALAQAARWRALEGKARAGGDALLEEGPDAAARLLADYGNWRITRSGDTLAARGLDGELAALLRPELRLPGGGSLMIERTAALTAIDVNTGMAPPASVNREAVEAIAAQIRLRNLSGLIVIDFAPPGPRGMEDQLPRALEKALAADPAGCRVAGLTPSGLVEITRARRDLPLAEKLDTERLDAFAAGAK